MKFFTNNKSVIKIFKYAVVVFIVITTYFCAQVMQNSSIVIDDDVTWENEDGLWRCYRDNKKMIKNEFITTDGSKFYVDSEGVMARGEIVKTADGDYLFDEFGILRSNEGWHKLVDEYYFVGSDGKVVKNSFVDSDYYVGENGLFCKDEWIYQVSENGEFKHTVVPPKKGSYYRLYRVNERGRLLKGVKMDGYYFDNNGIAN